MYFYNNRSNRIEGDEKKNFIHTYWTEIIFLSTVIITMATFIYITIQGVKCSLRNDILTIYDKCKDKEKITQYELEAVMLSADLYFKLKGNSFVQAIVNKIKDFQVIE